MEHEEQAERMGGDAERMEEHSEQLGERIDDIQSDWERKEQDPAVPGARRDPAQEEDDPDADEGETPNPGAPGEEETSTGNPDNAGAEE